jgi:AraC-like DNA-binding protein
MASCCSQSRADDRVALEDRQGWLLDQAFLGITMTQFTDETLFETFSLPVAVHRGVLDTPKSVMNDSVKVLFVTAGWASLRHRAVQLSLRPGNIVVLHRRVAYSLSPVGFFEAVGIYLRPEFLDLHLRWFPAAHPLVRQMTRVHSASTAEGVVDVGTHGMRFLGPRLSTLAEMQKGPSTEFAILARVADVFDHVAFLESRTRTSDEVDTVVGHVIPRVPVVVAVKAVHSDLDRAWTVSELARHASMSESQLTRLFKQDLGISPSAYLWAVRTDRMADILATSDVSIAEASRAVGWAYSSAASRAFKRRYGMSPRAFVTTMRTLGP